jgi:hypothetical protein
MPQHPPIPSPAAAKVDVLRNSRLFMLSTFLAAIDAADYIMGWLLVLVALRLHALVVFVLRHFFAPFLLDGTHCSSPLDFVDPRK